MRQVRLQGLHLYGGRLKVWAHMKLDVPPNSTLTPSTDSSALEALFIVSEPTRPKEH